MGIGNILIGNSNDIDIILDILLDFLIIMTYINPLAAIVERTYPFILDDINEVSFFQRIAQKKY